MPEQPAGQDLDEYDAPSVAATIARPRPATSTVSKLTAHVAWHGKPGLIVSDHDSKFSSNAMLIWSKEIGVALHSAEQPLGEPLLRELQLQAQNELLNSEIYYSLAEARIVIEAWRVHYNKARPHSSLS